MFENLQEKFEKAFKLLKGHGKITEINVAESLKEIRRALLDADVSYKVAKDFTTRVKEKAIGRNVLSSVTPGQLMVKITKEELTDLMGGSKADINYQGNPGVILLSGLQGSGKTTFSAKLAHYLKTKKGKNPLLIACDIYRPAAIEQLRILGGAIGTEVYAEPDNKDAVSIARNGILHARNKGFNVVVIDTAGRLAIDDLMMSEIEAVKQAVNPSETLFVVDAMTGQDAVQTARTFNERLGFDGVVLTKLDGDTRGGAALSIKAEINKPIKFVGIGEKPDALDIFYPERMADRILGMGDVVSLVERAQAHYDEEQTRKLNKKIATNKFDFNDFLEQITQVKKMGNMKDLMGMIPGASKALKGMEIPDDAFKHIEAIIGSMTPAERERPELLDVRRRSRIARGSGRSQDDVSKLIKQFDDARKVMKMMSNKSQMAQMMKAMQGAGKPGQF